MTRKNVLFFDVESYSATARWGMEPRKFVRLFQYAWGRDGEVHLTTDYDEMLEIIRSADLVVGHNITQFDLSVLFGTDSLEPLQMALQGKVLDTFVWANLRHPAPYSYTDRKGHTYFDAAKPENAKKWLSLDNLCFQFGLPGKFGDLKALAKKYNPKGTLIADLDYSLIPLDDEEFLEYAVQDVVALQGLASMMMDEGPITAYEWREMLLWAITDQITKNGILVDTDQAQARVDHLQEEKDRIMVDLVQNYGMPTEGKMPWRKKEGKEAIFAALATAGITPESYGDKWERTATGNPSLGGDVIKTLTEGTELEEFGEGLATLLGQRSLAQLALDSVQPDGRAHPDITALQRSGRWSMTKPGLTVWTKNEEKRYFVAAEGNVLSELDFSNADARAVAAVSGDPGFAKRFEPGVDGHDETGKIFFGEERYFADRDNLRPIAKAGGHAMAYRIGSKKLAKTVDVSQGEAQGFIDAYKAAYPWVARWQDDITAEGEKGFVVNDWGRKMPVDRDRSFTQSSALIGQSTTREMMGDSLIRIVEKGEPYIRSIRAIIHDALLLEFPADKGEAMRDVVRSCMEADFTPRSPRGQTIGFPVGVGPLADSWYTASH